MMLNTSLKKFSTPKLRTFINNYLQRLIFSNIIFLIFYNTSTYDEGLFSIQSIIYCLNKYTFYLFIFFEFISCLFDQYYLDYKFIFTIFYFFDTINIDYAKFIVKENFVKVFLFLFLNYFFIKFKNQIFKKNNIIILIFFIIFSKNAFFESRVFLPLATNFISDEKIYFFQKNYFNANYLRNENWFNMTIASIVKDKQYETLTATIDQKKFINKNNIYYVIFESYPTYKDNKKNEFLTSIILKNLKKDIYISYRKMGKNSTLGAEMFFLCEEKGNIIDFQKYNLNFFLKKNNCYFNRFENYNKIYIHSSVENSFNRLERFSNFFDKMLFFNDLIDKKFNECDGYFKNVCDHEILKKLDSFIIQKKKNLIFFLTTNNHPPVPKINKDQSPDCKKFNIYIEEHCYSFKNQILMNKNLNSFLMNLGKNDAVIISSDTFPLSTRREIYLNKLATIFIY